MAEIESGFRRFASKINMARQLVFYHNISLLYFANGKYAKALEWVDKIINGEPSESRIDIQRFALLLRLVIYLELESDDILEYRLRSAYRALQKENPASSFELLCLRNLKKLNNSAGFKDTVAIETLQRMSEELIELRQNSSNKILGMAEVQGWVESKLKGIDFKDLM